MTASQGSWRSEFVKLYQRLSNHYGNAFLRGAADSDQAAHGNHWQRMLHNERITPEEMWAAFDVVIKSQQYRKFPPNPTEFIGVVYRQRANEKHKLPDADQAFQQACGIIPITHPLVSHVRRKFGGWYLRSMAHASLRSRFIELYEQATEELARGEITLNESVEEAESEERSKPLSAEELSSRFDRLIGPSK